MHSKIKYFPFNKTLLNKGFKKSYHLNKKFRNLPGLSNFHNINGVKINNLIKSDDESHKVLKKVHNNKNLINNIHKSYDDLNDKNNTTSFFNSIYNKGKTFNNKKSNNIIILNKNNFLKFNNGSKKNIHLNKRYLNQNNLSCQKNNNPFLSDNNILVNSKSEKVLVNKLILSKKNKMNKLGNNNNNYENQKCITSLNDSHKNYEFPQKGSKMDKPNFYIENKHKSVDGHFFHIKKGDKYQLLKNQISKHKNKLEKIIKDMRINEINNEYLMKKYIYNLLSRKKKKNLNNKCFVLLV